MSETTNTNLSTSTNNNVKRYEEESEVRFLIKKAKDADSYVDVYQGFTAEEKVLLVKNKAYVIRQVSSNIT